MKMDNGKRQKETSDVVGFIKNRLKEIEQEREQLVSELNNLQGITGPSRPVARDTALQLKRTGKMVMHSSPTKR